MKNPTIPFLSLVLTLGASWAAETRPSASNAVSAWDKIPGAAQHSRIREARLRLLESAEAGEIERILQSIAANAASSEALADFLVATEIVARKNGVPALLFAKKHKPADVPDRSLRDAFVRGLAKAEVNVAAAWLETEPAAKLEEDEKAELARIVLQAHARRDPAGALERALRYADDDPSRRETFVLAVVDELAYHGRFERARALTRELSPPEMRSAVQANLIGVAAMHQPDLASAWFKEMPRDQERIGVVFRLVEAWASRSLQEAVVFFETLEPEDRSIDLVESMLVGSNDPRPESVEKLAAGFPPGPELDRLLTVALNRINLLQPADVPWNWFGRFTTTRSRDALLVSILASHYGRDPDSVQPILQQLAFLTPEQRAALQTAVVRTAPGRERKVRSE